MTKPKSQEQSQDSVAKPHAEATSISVLVRIGRFLKSLLMFVIKGVFVLGALALTFSSGASWQRNLNKDDRAGAPQLEPLAWRPRVFLARNFLSAEEARYIISLVKDDLDDSRTDYIQEGQTGSRRTSATGWLQRYEKKDKKVSAVIDRMHELAMVPRHHGEPTSVARYKNGQVYGWHHDSNEIELRLATVLVYLQSPGGGGETIFPFANGGGGPAKPPPFDASGGKGPDASTQFEEYCSGTKGVLKVKPQTGDAILFFSHLPSLKLDRAAWHASCPVTSGTKWVMQRWIKSIPFPKFVENKFNMSFVEWEQLVAASDRVKQAKKKMAKAQGQDL